MNNGYKCFYNKQTCEEHAQSAYAARQKAVATMKVPKKQVHMVSVALVEKEGIEVEYFLDK